MDAHARGQLWRMIVWIVVLACLALLLFEVLASGQDAGTLLSIFSTRFLGIFIEAAPFLLLGTLASGLIDAFVTPEDIARFVPKNKVGATFSGAFLGFLFPVCECGVVPVVRRLFAKGLPMSVGVAFLLAAPVVNPVVLVSTLVAFGAGPVLYGRFLITVFVAVTVGLVFALAAKPRDVLRPEAFAPVMGGVVDDIIPLRPRRKPLGAGLRDAFKTAGDEFFEMGRYMIIGTLVAATMQTFISQEFLLALGRGPVISVWAMQALAFLLSVCSTVDAFLALAFAGTFTTGSLLAFLTFGPMVDIKSTLMFAGVFRGRVVVYLIVLPLLLTMWIGIWLNLNVTF